MLGEWALSMVGVEEGREFRFRWDLYSQESTFPLVYLYLFFINSPTGQTRRRIFTLDGSNDADSRKYVPFGSFVDIAPHVGGEIPRKPQFWGRE